MRDVMYIIDTSRCVFFGDFLFRLVKKEIRYPYIREYCQIFQVICIQYEISLWQEILITSIYINHVKQSIVSAGGIIRIQTSSSQHTLIGIRLGGVAFHDSNYAV